jgi:hypothetical protein
MKLKLIRAHGKHNVGDELDLPAEQAEVVFAEGYGVTPAHYEQLQTVKAKEKAGIEQAVIRAKERGAVPAKDDKVLATALERFNAGKAEAEVLVEFIDGMAGKSVGDMGNRTIAAALPSADSGVRVTKCDIRDATDGVLKCTEPQTNLIRAGNFKEAGKLASEAATIMKVNHMDIIKGGGDVLLRDTIKAATTTDPNSQVGSLAGDLVIMRNLGYLKYKLPWIGKLTTDFSAEPARFGESVLTRYITPPDVLTWVPGVGFTSDTTTIGTSDTTVGIESTNVTQTVPGSGNNYLAPVKSVPSTTDRTVNLSQFKATEIEFPVSMLASTMRNLFGEQLSAQTYSLALEIDKFVLGMFFAPTGAKYSTGSAWTTTGYTCALDAWDLKQLVKVKNRATIAQMPDVGRFALLHSFYHDALITDANLLSAKAILALINKDQTSFESGELPTLFGLKPLESQLASATAAGALTTWTDDTTLGTTKQVGFVGNQSSGIFVSRPPQDFTTAATQLGVPLTASIRLVTEPDSGLTVMVFSYLDNGKMSISQRVCLMYGAAQGHPGQGFPLYAV